MQKAPGSRFVFHRAQGPGGDHIAVCRGCGGAVTLAQAHLPHFVRDHAHPELAAAPMQGVGDAVARFTSALGVRPCGGCKRRQAALNRAFPFR